MAGLSNPDGDDDVETRGVENCWDFEKGVQKHQNLEKLFGRFLSVLYREVYGEFIVRSFPPMLGDGETVDLLRLFVSVRERGGYDEVSKTGAWECVARECGFNSSVVASLKLVFVKYLDVLNRWLQRVEGEGGGDGTLRKLGGVQMELEPGFKGLLSEILEKKVKEKGCFDKEVKCELGFEGNVKVCYGEEGYGARELEKGTKSFYEKCAVGDGLYREFEAFVASRNNVIDDFRSIGCDGDEEVKEIDVGKWGKAKENCSGWKRKRGCYSDMLKWIRNVAKDPRNEALGTLPERSKWKSYGNDYMWKQVLLVREEMYLNTQGSYRENSQMHPAMYEDSAKRCSARVASVKESRSKCQRKSTNNTSDLSTDSTDDFWVDGYYQEPPLLGPDFQADVPEWKEETEGSDLNWLGSQIFPLVGNQQNKYVIERERIGKGRQDTCGCPSPGSLECVRFHIGEKRKRVKLELGPAFYEWKFDAMGEDAALSWTVEDRKKFQEIVKTNPFSEGLCFWDELVKAFPSKGRTALVSYYFNVFLVERRGYQNRVTPSSIDSDDDEADLFPVPVKQHTPGSIFCSPKS